MKVGKNRNEQRIFFPHLFRVLPNSPKVFNCSDVIFLSALAIKQAPGKCSSADDATCRSDGATKGRVTLCDKSMRLIVATSCFVCTDVDMSHEF